MEIPKLHLGVVPPHLHAWHSSACNALPSFMGCSLLPALNEARWSFCLLTGLS